jgi:hypothetical protein
MNKEATMDKHTYCPYCEHKFTIYNGFGIKVSGTKKYFLSCDCGATSMSNSQRTKMYWSKTIRYKTKIFDDKFNVTEHLQQPIDEMY